MIVDMLLQLKKSDSRLVDDKKDVGVKVGQSYIRLAA